MTFYTENYQGFKTLHFPSLQVNGTGHGFTSRQGPGESSQEAFAFLNMGLRTGEDPRVVKNNHRLFLKGVGLTGFPLVTGEQVHGSHVAEAGLCEEFCVIPAADGLVTSRKGLILSLFSADCALLFFIDRRGRAVGIAHAGWRGAVAGIGRNTALLLGEKYGILPRDLMVGISPCIEACCFEVKEDVLGALREQGIAEKGLITPSPDSGGSWYMDLQALNRRQLEEAGIPGSQIAGTGLCTSCRRDLFYSYRRDQGITGRMMGYVYLDRKGR